MLLTICGEHTVASRQYFSTLRNEYTQKGYEIKDIESSSVPDVIFYLGDNLSLFYKEKVFFTERLESQIVLKKGRKKNDITKKKGFLDFVEIISERKDITLINWEEKPQRDLKLKTISLIKEFKPDASLFKLLEICYPDNKNQFIIYLRKIAEVTDVSFLFIMLYRHIRSLILAHYEVFAPTMQSWQKTKLISQTKNWNIDKLITFYEKLYRIEILNRSGQSPYKTLNSLEILACYYL